MKIKLFATFLASFFLLQTHAQQFRVTFAPSAFKARFSGHVILYLSKTDKEPREGIEGPCYQKIVSRVMPGETVRFDDKAIFYPVPVSKLERGTYYVQAVWDLDLGGRNIGTSPGNLFNKAQTVTLTVDTAAVFDLLCDQVVPDPVFTNSAYVKEIKAPSRLLSNFFHKPKTMDGAVILPKAYYTEPKRHFPVLVTIAGYGSDYHHYSRENQDTLPANPLDTFACIRIYLDGNCRLGHSVYANSANNGPWGDAFVKEFIPELKKRFRCDGAIVLKGHSSGGWAALWLQTHYPAAFAGCNASAPDFVDFHSLNRRDYYATEDTLLHGGQTHPIITHPHIEDVLYRGEQDGSFDAVYGPKGADGWPVKVLDAKGRLIPQVFEHWKDYDITRYVLGTWQR